MSLISWISFIEGVWAAWGIQLLVAASFACKIVLVIFGNRRKYMTGIPATLVIWAAYLLLSYSVTIALGKVTVVDIDDPNNPGYDVVLQALLAPLLLIQLGYADGMTAYAEEDNRLGLRQLMKIGVALCIVVWILRRCWHSSSPVLILYFPLSVAGIIKSAGWVWALQSVYNENSCVTAEDMSKEARIKQVFDPLPKDEKFAYTKDILKAYYRFHCLKPHLVNWLYHPQFISNESMSIEGYPADRAFTMTEIELNFMFDALYTKAPILYTKLGLIGRFMGFFCLVWALCGFAMIFKNAFLIDMYITYTYALLMAVTSLELYQISMLAFSDWAVAKMGMNLKMPLVGRLLPFLSNRCMKQKRWSRSIGQLNLFDHRLYKECPKPIATVLDWFEKRGYSRGYRLYSCRAIPSSLRKLVVQTMTKLEEKRDRRPFTERGKWTLEIHSIQEKQRLSGSIATEFDKSIIIWHITTEMLQISESEKSDACRGSKLLSDYMIYLLAVHPYMLSLTTANIMLEHACCTLRPFLRYRDHKEAIIALCSPDGDVSHPVKPSKETWITRDWHLLSEVQKLVADLKTMDNKWEIISSIWVEMLCYAAHQCRVYHHANRLRGGGELITHVWLLLAYQTDKLQLREDELSEDPAASNESPFLVKGSSCCFRRMFG
ncbi:uncharacterized protein LOC115679518 [Syzygium oleosum]|uniref:uncharacterized protein LOC115679518 n=1 Tax=Syzygium oleosum TaxID=219896 RepID=UPI0011D24695|nr:uncharacterized protein LOC115679518 [Syzygium oleosum]XP_056166473.1 uncharacterized protein LOC115679518 [Syzygium oleosum]XP_056166474.1 uncharacterized protein LOC115679518 [Syzygium oleosum]XP_056166475.1 uncharacterized protein LOC115679518 [Syzygium oleosum]XP_056166476.1 uncharacterized protein LOC115679518 [Syzygium oleosum]XP_056166477.1 uncharacterized protein LOC115679518 [Syzygium oleosum]